MSAAGALDSGKQVFICGKLAKDHTLLGETAELWTTITNGHDGRHAVPAAYFFSINPCDKRSTVPMTPLAWIQVAYRDRLRLYKFTVHGLAGITHTSSFEAEQAIVDALAHAWVVPEYHWLCPDCAFTVAITEAPNPPTLDYCKYCNYDFEGFDATVGMPHVDFYRIAIDTPQPSSSEEIPS